MLRTAIDLKDAIDKIPNKLEPIGTCPLDEYYWKNDNGRYEDIEYLDSDTELDDDQEQIKKNYSRLSRINDKVNDITKNLREKYYHNLSLESDKEQLIINFKGIEYKGGFDIPSDLLKDLFDRADEAPFGNQNKLETVVDKEVRDARDISLEYFSVSESVIDQITKGWGSADSEGYRMYPSSVVVKPYKINLYGQHGHFKLHQDTPDKDMVGTAVVALTPSDNFYLVKNENEKYQWNSKVGDCVMFYTDCPHKVEKSYWQKDIRGTISFKIYHIPSDNITETNSNEALQIERVVNAIKSLEQTVNKIYGFLLGHGYSFHTNTLKGCDHILIESLNKLGKKYTIVPVIYKWYLYSYHENWEDDEIKSEVYPITEPHIEYVLNRGPKPEPLVSDMEFYKVVDTGYVWSSDHQEYAEHTGNESRPEEENSIYISRAVIIQ